MKFIRFLVFSMFFVPSALWAASNEFMVAAQLLAAARNGDIQQVQVLVNNGADVNFVDSTGLSVVCTALMNNDVKAAQILQMYGADASNCDRQIKKYNSRNKQERSGGLFSGLSSAQTLTLAAAGAAVVVGGLLLLTDVFDSDGHNDSGGGGNRPNGGGDGDGSGGNTATARFQLPYGPAMPNAESESKNYIANLNLYSTAVEGADILRKNFEKMNNFGGGQNYMLMMHGYSPLARGYMGMQTLRGNGNVPVTADALGKINIKGEIVGGGRPVAVALVTANGVNSATKKPDTADDTIENSLADRLLAWTTISGDAVNQNPEISNLSSKYYNNVIEFGPADAEVTNSRTVEDKNLVADFDLSGSGTAVQNIDASEDDDILAKIVGGSVSGYKNADYFGFMPNGQMGIFRTGAGRGFVNVPDGAEEGQYTEFVSGKTITLFGRTLSLTVNGNVVTAADGDDVYSGYIGADGLLYIADTPGGAKNRAYRMDGGHLILAKQYSDNIDYYNYRALLTAGALSRNDAVGGRSHMDILANASVIAPLHGRTTEMLDSILANTKAENFISLVNKYYDRNKTDGAGGSNALPGTDAAGFFGSLGSVFSPLVVFSTGASENVNGLYADAVQEATFENAAPLVFPNLEHLFMSVVAVGMKGATGTSQVETVSGYSPTGKFALAQWQNTNGTETTDDDKFYKARVCGIAGRGVNGMDPWCFASAGVTDELAVSSAAGAAGAVKSAFSYMNNREVFTLLALTADGPYLATLTDGTALTKDSLRSYLQGMYELPAQYQYRVDNGKEEYLDVFKEVFGYGLINLERATKPGTQIFYYDANSSKIVSDAGNAYWRAAAKTRFRPSAVFGGRDVSISAPFFDVLESADGELRLPRVWENEFSLGASRRRGLYMNDVFDDLKTGGESAGDMRMGDMRLSMTTARRAYDDNMGGLDTFNLGMARGNWDLAAGYQHRFTDGAGMFTGMANPIMSLAGDAMTGGAKYSAGRWNFGVRAFSGAITDSELLENDPTITAQYTPARLGLMHGGVVGAGWGDEKLSLNASFGFARETETILGTQTGGLLDLGGGNTSYVELKGHYDLGFGIRAMAQATFAHTAANPSGLYILSMSDIYSDAFALGLNFGGFELVASRPLAARSGRLTYSYADYEVTDGGNGRFDIVTNDAGVRGISLRAPCRETRFAGTYRHSFGEFTDGAVGFIYRINPDNTDEFGNETVFMLKLLHRVGI